MFAVPLGRQLHIGVMFAVPLGRNLQGTQLCHPNGPQVTPIGPARAPSDAAAAATAATTAAGDGGAAPAAPAAAVMPSVAVLLLLSNAQYLKGFAVNWPSWDAVCARANVTR